MGSTEESSETEPSMLSVDGKAYAVEDIRSTGDVILDVSFENTSACNKSIPADEIRKLRTSKAPIPSPRMFYRVRLDTLKKSSRYFERLLGPQFAEGAAITKQHEKLASLNLSPSEVEAEMLPKIKIVDEDVATKTIGREKIFGDLLRIIHGGEHTTKPVNLNSLTILVVLADRFNTLPAIARYFQKTFVNFKYPITVDPKAEEALRQKILIFYHTDQALRFTASTRELILRGSSRWSVPEESENDFQTAWWDLPDGLEVELAHRRACVLRTIASVQTQFLGLYTSKERQCTLGYDTSAPCDSFQLGEMIKFLVKKDLVSLVPFQASSPEDDDYIWPDAYTGDVENLIGLLRQCPSYQINQYHGHCGLRSKILPILEYIKACIETGVGIKFGRKKGDWANDAWSLKSIPNAESDRKPFYVGTGHGDVDVTSEGGAFFDFGRIPPKGTWGLGNDLGIERAAKKMFTAERWNWVKEHSQSESALKGSFSTPSMRAGTGAKR